MFQRQGETQAALNILKSAIDRFDGAGLLLAAARRWRLDRQRSFMIGDRWSDIVAGQSAGCRTALVEKPYSRRKRCTPDFCAADLAEAVHWILGSEKEISA